MAALVLVLALIAIASGSAAAAPERPCRAALPSGPAVPAPIVLRTGCGGFLLARDGTVGRLPPGWFAVHSGGTGRRYGADLRLERTRPGRIILHRQGRVAWRSRDVYHRDAGDVAFGPGAFAFASYRRGVFVTDLHGPERLVMHGVGLYPLAFLANGELLVVKGGWGPSVSVLSRDGSPLRRYRYRPRNGYAYDQRTESLFFVTPERELVRAEGTAVRVVRALNNLDGWLSRTANGRLVFQDDTRVTVLTRDGEIVARARWRSRWSMDSGLFASRDGRRFAFRLRTPASTSFAGGRVVVSTFRAGESRAHAVYRHRLGESGCAMGATIGWHGSALLYTSTDGHLAVVDRGRVHGLTALGAALPKQDPGEIVSAYWASSFPRASRSFR